MNHWARSTTGWQARFDTWLEAYEASCSHVADWAHCGNPMIATILNIQGIWIIGWLVAGLAVVWIGERKA